MIFNKQKLDVPSEKLKRDRNALDLMDEEIHEMSIKYPHKSAISRRLWLAQCNLKAAIQEIDKHEI